MNFRRKRTRRNVRCAMCTPHRMGNTGSKAGRRTYNGTTAKVANEAALQGACSDEQAQALFDIVREEMAPKDLSPSTPQQAAVIAEVIRRHSAGERVVFSTGRHHGKSVMRRILEKAGIKIS